MYHFFSEHEHIHDTYIDIVGSDVNHIKNVLRLKTGDSLLISSGDNIDYTCHIAQIDEEHIRADIDSVDERGRELASKIYLFQGLPKADKMELVIQKAVELGGCHEAECRQTRCQKSRIESQTLECHCRKRGKAE